MENLNKFGLVDSLLYILNTNRDDDIKIIIAKYLLDHIYEISDLNIFDVAEECGTNRTTIRRFCSMIGINNFKDLKNNMLPMEYYLQGYSADDFLNHIRVELNSLTLDVNECVIEFIKEFTELIHTSDNTIIYASDIYASSCTGFQKEMILSNKLVRIVSHNYENNLLTQNLGKDDLVIVVSISGRWADEVLKTLSQLNGTKVLITTVQNNKFNQVFNKVYRISKHSQEQRKTLYHAFGIQYFFEILLHSFRSSQQEFKQ